MVRANNVKVPVENAKAIGEHVLEFIANKNNARGSAIRRGLGGDNCMGISCPFSSPPFQAEIVFAIGTSSKCIEVYSETP